MSYSTTLLAEQNSETLTIASFVVPPYIIKQPDGSLTGIFVETIKEAAKQSGVRVEFSLSNWARAQSRVEHGEIDAIWPVVKTKERQAWLHYPTEPINQFRFSLFANAERNFEFNGELESLSGLTLGKLNNAKTHPLFHQGEQQGVFLVKERTSLTLLLQAVSRKRLDGFVAPERMVEWLMRESRVYNVEPLPTAFGVNDIYLGLSKLSHKQEPFTQLYQAARKITLDETLWIEQYFQLEANDTVQQ
ncbi:transporter substrate-binding domain-containing protein [Agarivorans sp. TSD2052]|uniref:substrate-binding periplasmic protein n=1 Tax=Agarivorans sp. TSD2052 TaxID=2937286 RepID=UPI00200D59AF|nr:transporter substrate-binding domain-containing protein [Agarivorans sp. TSD2052]UPW17468.1 transporter substrate-binding domain-containing protein [Agarivorans sp. TSD2052]